MQVRNGTKFTSVQGVSRGEPSLKPDKLERHGLNRQELKRDRFDKISPVR
jgi:hypothetical protein